MIKNSEYIPFEGAEEAWLWCCLCETLEHSRTKSSMRRIERPCESSDILRSVKKLVLSGKLTQNHIKVLSKYGLMQLPPHENFGHEKTECSLWREALNALGCLLRLKGIVV